MFFAKTSAQLNNHNIEPGETLFQYLKRKKHIELKKSLESSFHKSPASIQPTPIQQVPKFSKSTQNKQSARQASTKRRPKKSSNKKKKADQSHDSRKQNQSQLSNLCQDIFKSQKTTRRSLADTGSQLIFQQKIEPAPKKIPGRSFTSMISPLKSQVNFEHSPHSRVSNSNLANERKSVKKNFQFNSKKMIKQAIAKVEKYCNEQIEFERQIKEKMRQFFISLNSILIQTQDSTKVSISDGVQKKIKELRSNMKMINGYFTKRQEKEKEDINLLIEQMYISVNQIVDSFEGKVKQSSNLSCQSIILKKQEQFEQKIEALTKQRNDLNRQVNTFSKEYNKLEREYNQLLQKYSSLEEQGFQKRQDVEQREKENIQELQDRIQEFSQQNTQLTNKISLLEKKLKDSEYKFEEYSRRIHIEHHEKLTERQNYLLKQISLLKAQCARDITNLNTYYANREEHYPKKLKEFEKIISDQLKTIQNLENALKDTEKVTKLQQANVKESKRKVEEVMADLYRINEELYKHWLALKDIKTLLSRLNMYDKFERIFKDIPFDDVLFLP